mgnify:CR=1 FL=1
MLRNFWRMLIMAVKSLNAKNRGPYSVCKSHVFTRNQLKGRPEKSLLSIAVYERNSQQQKNNENEDVDINKYEK